MVFPEAGLAGFDLRWERRRYREGERRLWALTLWRALDSTGDNVDVLLAVEDDVLSLAEASGAVADELAYVLARRTHRATTVGARILRHHDRTG